MAQGFLQHDTAALTGLGGGAGRLRTGIMPQRREAIGFHNAAHLAVSGFGTGGALPVMALRRLQHGTAAGAGLGRGAGRLRTGYMPQGGLQRLVAACTLLGSGTGGSCTGRMAKFILQRHAAAFTGLGGGAGRLRTGIMPQRREAIGFHNAAHLAVGGFGTGGALPVVALRGLQHGTAAGAFLIGGTGGLLAGRMAQRLGIVVFAGAALAADALLHATGGTGGRVAVPGAPGMILAAAGGCAAHLAGAGLRAACRIPLMPRSVALRFIAPCTNLGFGAGGCLPGMPQRRLMRRILRAAADAKRRIRAGGVLHIVTQGRDRFRFAGFTADEALLSHFAPGNAGGFLGYPFLPHMFMGDVGGFSGDRFIRPPALQDFLACRGDAHRRLRGNVECFRQNMVIPGDPQRIFTGLEPQRGGIPRAGQRQTLPRGQIDNLHLVQPVNQLIAFQALHLDGLQLAFLHREGAVGNGFRPHGRDAVELILHPAQPGIRRQHRHGRRRGRIGHHRGCRGRHGGGRGLCLIGRAAGERHCHHRDQHRHQRHHGQEEVPKLLLAVGGRRRQRDAGGLGQGPGHFVRALVALGHLPLGGLLINRPDALGNRLGHFLQVDALGLLGLMVDQQREQGDAHGIQIRRGALRTVDTLFGRGVHALGEARHVRLGQQAGGAEVNQVDLSVDGHEDIIRADIAVQDFLAVHAGEHLQRAKRVIHALLEAEGAMLLQLDVLQGLALQVGHHQIAGAEGLKEIAVLHHAGDIPEHFEVLGLSAEFLLIGKELVLRAGLEGHKVAARVAQTREFREVLLDGQDLVLFQVAGNIGRAEAAPAQAAAHQVALLEHHACRQIVGILDPIGQNSMTIGAACHLARQFVHTAEAILGFHAFTLLPFFVDPSLTGMQ